MPRIPRIDTYQTRHTSAETQDSVRGVPASSETSKPDKAQPAAFVTLPHLTPHPPSNPSPNPNQATAALPFSTSHLTKASAVYKFHRKGQFFPGVRAHHYYYYSSASNNSRSSSRGAGQDAGEEGSPMQDHREADESVPSGQQTRGRHHTRHSPRSRDALARAHHRNFLKLCGKLPGGQSARQRRSTAQAQAQNVSGMTTPSTSRTSQPLMSISSPHTMAMSGTQTQRSTIIVPPSHLNDTLTNTAAVQPPAALIVNDEPAPLTDETELVFGIGTHGLSARDALQRTMTQPQAQPQALQRSEANAMGRHIADLLDGSAEQKKPHEGNPLPAQTPQQPTATSRAGHTGADAMTETMKGNTASTTTKASVFARLRGKKAAQPVACFASTNTTASLPRLVRPAAGAAAQASQTSFPMYANASHKNTQGSKSNNNNNNNNNKTGAVLPSLAHADLASEVPQGGMMDVFGYFATHRVQPEYYARLKADHDGRRQEHSLYLHKTMPKLTAMRTIAVD